MAPKDHLPSCSITSIEWLLDEINFPKPLKAAQLSSSAQFHSIWIISYAKTDLLESQYPELNVIAETCTHSLELVLRISGNHIPHVKTDNEVGILTWLHKNTSLPVPLVLQYDASDNNAIGFEYMLMTKLPGKCAGDIFKEINPSQMDHLLQQLAVYMVELYSHPFAHAGGLRVDERAEIKPGSPVDEYFWHVPEIEKFWPGSETFETLNPITKEGYSSFSAWIAGFTGKYIHALQVHPSLSWIGQEEIQRLKRFVVKVNEQPLMDKINATPLRLAHRDLHFGNILVDTDTFEVTGLLDWEFSQILPLPLWRRSFLITIDTPLTPTERNRLYDVWRNKVAKLPMGGDMLKDMKWRNSEQEAAFDACDYLRCVVEVCPRNEKLNESRKWWQEVKKGLQRLNIE